MRGSNNFINNIEWWYWDNAKYPCLFNRDQFSLIRTKLLDANDQSLLTSSLIADTIVSFDGTKTNQKNLDRLLRKLAVHLEGEFVNHPESYRELTQSEFNEDPQSALKAHINVHGFWGLGYTWEEAQNHRGLPQLILRNKSNRQLVLPVDQLMFLQGRPHRFTLSLKGGSLSFDESIKHLSLSWRERGSDDETTVRETTF
jgi:hypothetical protein